MKCSLGISNFLERSLVFPILLFSSSSLHWSLRKAFLSLLAILWNSHSNGNVFHFLLCLLHLFLSHLFVWPPQTPILPFCISLSWEWFWSPPFVLWRYSKLAKNRCVGSLDPRFVNIDYVTAESIYSSAYVHREIYATFEITYSTRHANHEVLTWSRATLCRMLVWVQQETSGCFCTGAALEWHHGYVTWGSVVTVLLLHYDYVVHAAKAAASARKEAVLWLPCHPGDNKRVCSSYISSHLLPAS